MNTKPLQPGYVVEARDLFQPDRYPDRSFTNADLLTARQEAFQYAQLLASQKLPTDGLDMAIHLAEFDGEQVTIPYIAQVFAHRFHRSEYAQEDSTNVIEFSVDVDPNWTGEPLPETLELTFDLTRDDEAFDSPKAVWNSLGEMTCEYEYYQSYGHPAGFGYMILTLSGPRVELPKDKSLSLMSEDESQDRIDQLRQPKPFSTFYLLYDGLSYAANLISNYNQYYAEVSGSLSFNTKFLAQH